jgi:hypothetical protein
MASARAIAVPQNSPGAAPARTQQGPGAAHSRILGLQRSAGNAAVARLMAARPADPSLQRCGGNSACGCGRKDADEEDLDRRQLDAGARLLRAAVAARGSNGTTRRILQRCGGDSACGCGSKERDEDDVEGRRVAAGARLLRDAVVARKADSQLVQRVGWKDVPLIGKTLWCQLEMGHAYALKAECMKEFKEVCSGDMLDPACTNFCRRPLLKRDERAWWERWFGLAPDPNRVVPMAEPGSSGDISGCILDCMKSKDPEAMGTFLEVCSGNAASAMGD